MPSTATTRMMNGMGMSTMTTSAATTSAHAGGMDMGGMGMGMGDGPACKISMLWNWYTVDACFLSAQWRITSHGMMAGSCIGVVFLVTVLEGLRRASREYDAYIVRKFATRSIPTLAVTRADYSDSDENNKPVPHAVSEAACGPTAARKFRPSLLQQAVRSGLHMLQFAVAYFIMLLAMYFNGYIIISILVGAFVGAFIFSWHSMELPGESRELTYCCG